MFYTNVYQQWDKIYVRGYTSGGKRFSEVIDYQPYLFILDKKGAYKTWDGRSATQKKFDRIKSARDFVKNYADTNVEIFGLDQFTYAFINDFFPGTISYRTDLLCLVSLDIEVSTVGGFPNVEQGDKEITAITITKGDDIACFGCKAYTGKEHQGSYVLCKDESDLLVQFLNTWAKWSPDVVTGWSIDQFDIPYLVNRILRILGEKWVAKLSPYGKVNKREITRGKSVVNTSSRQEVIYEIAGIASLDYIHLYRKFTSSGKESYALNHIAYIELGERKVDYSEYGNLDNLYDLNYDLFIDYNIHDARLVARLEQKLNYIQQCIAIAYRAKVNYTDALTTTRPWDMIIHNYLLERKIVIPQSKENMGRELPGAYVKDPVAGLHTWVASFDYTSEYPSILSQLNISPETWVKKIPVPGTDEVLRTFTFGDAGEEAQRLNCTIAMNGCLYSKEKKGFIPELIDGFMAERGKIKKESLVLQKQDNYDKNQVAHLDNMAQAIKILMNGLYGALSNLHFRWFNIDQAESVTTTGQLSIRYMEQSANKYLNKVLKSEGVDYVSYSDTDSIYINLTEVVKLSGYEGKTVPEIIEFMDQICNDTISPYLARRNKELSDLLNSFHSVLKINREVLVDKAIWRGKKMYILNVWDKEGVRYKEAQIKVKGMEIVRSSTPMYCRNKLKEAIKIIMDKDQRTLQKFIKETENEFFSLPPADIAFPRSVSNVEEYYDPIQIYKKGTPVAVRAAICHNQFILKGDLQIVPIKSGEKIKWVYMKPANPVNSHVFGFREEIPIKWGLDKYIDYQAQWEKAFLSPLQSITDLIKWRTTGGRSPLDFMKKKG